MSERNYSNSDETKTLIFACSGGADVGDLSDRAARQMMKDGCGKMFCLSGLGGGVTNIINITKNADTILVIDGCPVDCAKKTMQNSGINEFKHFQITSLGFEKGSTVVDENSIMTAAEYGKSVLK